MKREVEYSIRLGEVDRYRHKHIRVSGEIVHFRVQFETLIGGKWYPVVRYDTSHGFAHRDLINRKGEVKKLLFLSMIITMLSHSQKVTLGQIGKFIRKDS